MSKDIPHAFLVSVNLQHGGGAEIYKNMFENVDPACVQAPEKKVKPVIDPWYFTDGKDYKALAVGDGHYIMACTEGSQAVEGYQSCNPLHREKIMRFIEKSVTGDVDEKRWNKIQKDQIPTETELKIQAVLTTYYENIC